ncbi:cupin domain-containing protein [Phytoactinopolyspora mesophila]|uniref:Cupin domain-containing protein n=1 Tax=Phytoactinopolyspora mesophila TaxID=2650750 RepID=A0A7K3M821_9ACTN|nr:cupin domain-containing protein [Phytoactinopolyspora mesophila]NDL59446.1 cupin domain-containing protein [Phytoactinopolyspora mesophila]
MTALPAFPGATSVSRLSVYPDACQDGLAGGTPHMHTASAEGYVVVGGSGALQTVDMSGFRETELGPGSTVWFTPGTIHRAINRGELEVIVVMQNSGLPEAGDAVMTFPPDVVSEVARYRAAATLPVGEPEEVMADAVTRRRELAVEGFLHIAERVSSGDTTPLEEFYDHAVALVREAAPGWRETWEASVARETRKTAEVLDALERGDGEHLRASAVLESPPSETSRWGMCGRLRTHDVAHPHVHSAGS